jgi:hypothetical protein
MPTGTPLPVGWKGTFLAALGRGDTIQTAADAAEIGVSTVYALKARDEEFQQEWDAAKRLRAERRKDWVLDKLHVIAEDDDHKAQVAALFKLFDALPENRIKELAVTGDPNRPIIVEHRRGLTLADLVTDERFARLRSLEPARGELSDAGEVLAESE